MVCAMFFVSILDAKVFQINRLPPNTNRIQTVESLWSDSYLKVLVVWGAPAGSIIKYQKTLIISSVHLFWFRKEKQLVFFLQTFSALVTFILCCVRKFVCF